MQYDDNNTSCTIIISFSLIKTKIPTNIMILELF